MAKKKSPTGAAEKKLKAAVKKLRSQLTAAEKSAAKWKARAKDHKSVAAGVKAELAVVKRRLEKAEASVLKWKERAKTPAAAPPPLAAVPDPAPLAVVPDSTPAAPALSAVPDESWTVAALRAEARSQGLPNYSRKSKAQLIAELGG